MSWDPGRYLRFSDLRIRPGLELLGRIDVESPRLVVDLGCGPGNLTRVLAQRWPDARVVGVDSSPAMLARAASTSSEVTWIEADLTSWEPPDPVDVIFSNAALHWVERHEVIFPRLASTLAPGGHLAVQMPANWAEPTHRLPAAILDGGGWPADAVTALVRDRVRPASFYRRLLSGRLENLDIWTTTYHQQLGGADPVLRWVEGSVLAPVLDALDPASRLRFSEECADSYRRAYPPEPDGTTILPFTRLFIVGKRP